MCGICGAIDLPGKPIPDLEQRLEVMSVAARPSRTGRRGHLDPRPRPRRARPPAPEHHRSRARPPADERRARPLDHVQRRDLQLSRAAHGDRRRSLPHDLRHRGRAPRPRRGGAPTGCSGFAACSPTRCGTSRARSWSASATASGSSRSTTPTVGDVVYFASEAKALLPFLPSIETDLDALKDYLAFQFCLAGKTLFKGIEELLPGHFLRVGRGAVDAGPLLGGLLRRSTSTTPRSYFEEQIEALLRESVELHLRSDVPVVGLSQRRPRLERRRLAGQRPRADGPMHAFTGKFSEDERYDESRYARALAECARPRAARGRHRRRRLRRATSANVVYHLDFPVAGPGSFPQFMVSQAASRHVQGDPRRPGRRRDLRRLHALPGRVLRAVHQGRDRRDDARRQLRRHLRVDHPQPGRAAELQADAPGVLARRAVRGPRRPLLPPDQPHARTSTARSISRRSGDYSPFETFRDDLQRRRTSATRRTSTR